MAIKDFKSIQVAPGNEDKTVRLWMSFGWELKYKQRVKNQDSQVFTRQDSDGTEHYRITKGVDFYDLTFERDPERKNYAELKSLEEQYYSMKKPVPPVKPVRFGNIWLAISFFTLLIIVGCYWLSISFFIPSIMATLFIIIVEIIIIIWRFMRYSELKKNYYEEYAVYRKEFEAANKKRQEIVEKARSLV